MARRATLTGHSSVSAESPPIPKQVKPTARTGKRPVMFWLDKAAHQELQVATKRMETTIQAAGEEMFADWCRKHAVKVPGA